MSWEIVLEALIVILLVILNLLTRKIPEKNGELIDRVLRLAEDRERKKVPGRPLEPPGIPASQPLSAEDKEQEVNSFIKRMTGGS